MKTVTLSEEKWQKVLTILRSNIHHVVTCLNQETSWYGDDSPGVKILKNELEEAKSLFEEVQKQVEKDK